MLQFIKLLNKEVLNLEIKRDLLDLTQLFGKDRAQEDKNLQCYFIKTRQYEEIKRGDKELVLGRKGAGKSALFSILAQETKEIPNTIPVKISFDGEDFIYIENWLKSNQFSEPLNDDFKYSLAWQNFILNEIIYASIPYIKNIDNALREKLVKEEIISEIPWKRFAKSILNVIKGVNLQTSLGNFELEFSNLHSLNDTDKAKINNALSELISKYNFFIVIDNLDEPWKNNHNMNSWLRGLIFSIRQLKRAYNNLKIVAFLRTDIYEIISKESDLFDSKSEITTISWDDNNYFSLKQLIAARIAHYLGDDIPTNFKDIYHYWNLFYPLNIYYNRKPNYLSNYLIKRTFQRPRELLQFCRLIIESSKKIYLPIEENAIAPAELLYSTWKLTDLSGEYSKTCKNIDKCIMTFVGVSKKWDWDVNVLIKHLDNIEDSEKIFDANTKRIFTSKETITFLYKIGFLRKIILSPNKRIKYKMYYEDDIINFQTSIFDIHPAFRKKFTNS